MRNYEIMFIINPNTPEEEVDKINSQIEGVITSGGGQVQKIEKMGRRKLAYEIDKHREGQYVLVVTTANGDIVREVERRLRVMDTVIKYITVRTDEEVRRLEKMKAFRQKRAAKRGSSGRRAAVAELPEQSVEDVEEEEEE
jgi:small subunit ribosomal protein S6